MSRNFTRIILVLVFLLQSVWAVPAFAVELEAPQSETKTSFNADQLELAKTNLDIEPAIYEKTYPKFSLQAKTDLALTHGGLVSFLQSPIHNKYLLGFMRNSSQAGERLNPLYRLYGNNVSEITLAWLNKDTFKFFHELSIVGLKTAGVIVVGIGIGVAGGYASLYGLASGAWLALRSIVLRGWALIGRKLVSGLFIKAGLNGLFAGIATIANYIIQGKPISWAKTGINTVFGFVSGMFLPEIKLVRNAKEIFNLAKAGGVSFILGAISSFLNGARQVEEWVMDGVLNVISLLPAGIINKYINWRSGREPIKYILKNFVGQFAKKEFYRQAVGAIVDVVKEQVIKPTVNFVVDSSKKAVSNIYNFSKGLW